jgi:tRNA(Ile)-lysidine synthase
MREVRDRLIGLEGAQLLVCVSGGQDSLCLLDILRGLNLGPLVVLHVDHRWRKDSEINANYVKELCEGWGIPIIIRVPSNTLRNEVEAREFRYREAVSIAIGMGISYVVTGHTLSDRVETILFNLIRGTGLKGLIGPIGRRPLDKGHGIYLIRPLLDIRREDTLKYCEQHALTPYIDSTNHELVFSRNRIRMLLMPLLRFENPQVEGHINNTAIIIEEALDFISMTVDRVYEDVYEDPRGLNIIKLRGLHTFLRKEVIKQYLISIKGDVTNKDIHQVLGLIDRPGRVIDIKGARVSSIRGYILGSIRL